MDDRSIIARVLAGDTEAYRHLVDRYKDRVHGVLVRTTGDPALAAELAQDAFVKAYRSLESFRGEAAFGTWVVQIGIHGARDHFRRRKREADRGVVSLEAWLEDRGETIPAASGADDPDALTVLERGEIADRLEEELERLPDAYRTVFVLKHVEGWSYEAIAETTGDSVGSLKVRAHRARKMLKEALSRPAQGGTARRMTWTR